MSALRKIKARISGAPDKVDALWPYAVSVTRNGMYTESLELVYSGFSGSLKRGDVVPLLSGNGKVHHYRLVRDCYMQGGDWGGVSNRKFWFVYSYSRPNPQD